MDDLKFEIGRIRGVQESVVQKLDAIAKRLDEHVTLEETRLQHIEQQLSIGRFTLFLAKAIVLTIIAVLTLQFGDIAQLWRVK